MGASGLAERVLGAPGPIRHWNVELRGLRNEAIGEGQPWAATTGTVDKPDHLADTFVVNSQSPGGGPRPSSQVRARM